MENALWNQFLSKMHHLADGWEQENVGEEKDLKSRSERHLHNFQNPPQKIHRSYNLV